MKKTPSVWFSLCLMLAVFASAATYTTPSGVTFENGCLSGKWYFHLKCDDDAKTCELSQHETTSPTAEDYQCWYNGTSGDLITALNTDKAYYTLFVTSPIDLGGYDASNNLCVMDYSPITIIYSSFDGKNNSIEGFCYVTTGDVGFFKKGSSEVKDVTFKNAYVKGTGDVGIIASSISSATLTNITIDSATVVGDNAGGIAGEASYFYWKNSVINNLNVTGSVAGGAFGYVSFYSGSFGWTAENNTFSGNNVIRGTSIAGGFIGSARITSKYMYFNCNYSTIKVDVLLEVSDDSYSGNLYAGGAIGYVETSASENNYVSLNENIFNGSVKVLAKDVTGNVYVGGLVGFANNSYYASPSLESSGTISKMSVDVGLGSVEGNVAVGGVYGYALEYSSYGGFKTKMRDASVESDVKLTTDNVKGKVSVGGVFGDFEDGAEFNSSSFRGSVSYETSRFDSQSFLYMGSIWGNANSASLELQYSYSFGNVTYSGVNASQANVGYFGGYSNITGTIYNRILRNNYYYSLDNDIRVGVGNLTETEWEIGYTEATPNHQNGRYVEDNARNAVSDADIDHAEDHRNQIYSEAEMKTNVFAYKIGKGVWTQYGDEFPTFPTGNNLAICKISIDISSFDQDVKDEIKSKYEVTADSARIYSDSKGKLKEEDVTYFNSLLKTGDYWYGATSLSTSSTYDSNLGYGIKAFKDWYVMYHFRAPNKNDNDKFDVNKKIWPSFEPVGDYNISFLSAPVASFESDDYSALVPLLYVEHEEDDASTNQKRMRNLRIYVSSFYVRNVAATDSVECAASDTAYGKNNRFFDLVNIFNSCLSSEGLDIEKYEDTLHVVYNYAKQTREDSLRIKVEPTPNGGTVKIKVQPYYYDAIANTLKQTYSEDSIYSNQAGTNGDIGEDTVKILTGYRITVDSVPIGYSDEKYTLYFGFVPYSNNQKQDTLTSSDNYLIDPIIFSMNDGYKKHIWKREGVSEDSLILLDSIYKGVKRAELYDMSSLKMTVVPVLKEYTVSFDLTSLKESDTYAVLGESWSGSTKTMDMSAEHNAFPKVYVMEESGSIKLFSEAKWSLDSNASANSSSYDNLALNLLTEIDTASKFTMYPYVRIGSGAETIQVVGYDAIGNVLIDSSKYHGNIVLTQTADKNLVFSQPSGTCDLMDDNGNALGKSHCLYIPPFNDILTFKVSLEPKPGCTMTLNDPSFEWTDKNSGNKSENFKDSIGYRATDSTLIVARSSMKNMQLNVKYAVTGPFYIKYDLNTSEDDEDKLFFPVNAKLLDTLTYSETVTSHTLWRPYRTDKCFVGWYDSSSVRAGSTDDALRSFKADYAVSKLEANPANPPKIVYAIWEDCANGPASIMTIANGGSRANIKLKQTFGGKEYTHVLADQNIALGSDSCLFTVDTVGSMKGIGDKAGDLRATSVVTERDGISFSEPSVVPLNGMTLIAAPLDADDGKISPNTIYTLTLLRNEYIFVYDMNTKANVFFAADSVESGAIRMSLNDKFLDNQDVGRVDACLDGWTLDTTNGSKKYTELDYNLLKVLDSLNRKDTVTLFAAWKSCSQETFSVSMSSEMEDFGKFRAYNVMKNQNPFSADTIWFDIGKNGLDVPTFIGKLGLKFESAGLYSVDSIYGVDAATYQIDHDTLIGIADGEMFNIAPRQKNLILYSPIRVLNRDFVLDVNIGRDSVFYGKTFDKFSVYAKENAAIPMAAYRIGYKLAGWRFEKTVNQSSGYNFNADPSGILGQIAGGLAGNLLYAPKTHQVFNKAFEEDYVMYYLTYGHVADTLYAVWEPVENTAVNYVVNKSPDVGKFTLAQEVDGEFFERQISDSLAVPAQKDLQFRVTISYDNEKWEIDDHRAVIVLNNNGVAVDTIENGWGIMIDNAVGLKANVLKDKRVKFVLNENSEDEVYFGSDWVDSLTSDKPDSTMELPTIVYNSEKCLAGWMLDSTSDELIKLLDKATLDTLRAKGKMLGVGIGTLLYAKWTTNPDSCAGQFVQLAVEQENGSVWFDEQDSNKTIERRFTDKGTMFVPRELDGRRFKVQASGVDTSVYVLDSLVVLRFGDRDTVLHDGDYMPEVLDNVTLKAYFGWKNKTDVEFVKAHLDSSGVMFKLSFKASDFEVRRRVSAWMQVFDVVKDSVVKSLDFGDSVAMGYDTAFVFPMRKPGDYRMVVTLEDKSGFKDTVSKNFSVKPEIASIAMDSWQMLSLSAVDMSSIKRDGDQIFYWWDEQGTGEFWQYKQLDLNKPVDASVGVWYNSLEGRPLALRDDIDDEGDDFVWKFDYANSGWNMVANPHGWAVDLYAKYHELAKNADEESEVTFWKWNTETSNYDPTPTRIGPYEALWAQVSKKTEWEISAEPVFGDENNAAEKSRALVKATTKDRWTLRAKLTDKNGKQDSWNILGAGLNPVAADEPPEGMGDHVSLAFVEGKRALAKSIKVASDEMEWTIALSASSDRVGYLTLDGIDGVKAYGYHVFVTVDGNTTEMQDGVPLTVYLESRVKTATVRVAPSAKIVAQNTLKGLRMARLGNQLRVSFDASGLAGTNARVDILDMKGHVMSTVTAKTLEGTNALVLDAPQSGLYMLRVRAGSQRQVTKVLVK